AEQVSTPTTSSVTTVLSAGPRSTCPTRAVAAASVPAHTNTVGAPTASSGANPGPPTEITRPSPPSNPATSCAGDSSVSACQPFVAITHSASPRTSGSA